MIEWIVNNIGGIIVAIGLAASAAIFIKGSTYKGAIAAQGAALAARSEEIASLKSRVDNLEKSDEKKTIEIESLHRENQMLREQRPSQELILGIAKKLDIHHAQTEGEHETILEVLKELTS